MCVSVSILSAVNAGMRCVVNVCKGCVGRGTGLKIESSKFKIRIIMSKYINICEEGGQNSKLY